MALTREQKKRILEDLKEKVSRQKTMIFVDFAGVKTKEMSGLRRKLKVVDAQLKVAKKTLAKIAFNKEGLKIETEKLGGELAIIFGFKDEISPLKIACQFSRENKNLKVLGGYFENRFRSAEEMLALAQLPSREELLWKLIGSVSAPISGLINVLEGNIKGLIIVLAKAKT